MEETKMELRLLIIGRGTSSKRRSYMNSKYDKEKLMYVEDLPEPLEKEEIEEGLKVLKEKIEEFNPDVVIGSSRGGKYAVGKNKKKKKFLFI